MGNVNVNFKGNTSSLNTAIKGVRTGVRGLGTAVKTALLPLAAIGAAIGGIATLFKGIGLAAELEQVKVKFQTILGSTEEAESLLQKLRNTAKSTPYEFDQITKAADQLIVKFGGGDDMITRLRQIGDVASGTGNDLSELAKIYAQVGATNRVDQEKVNQLAERGIPIYKELAKVLGVAESGVRDIVSKGGVGFKELDQVFKNLTSEGGLFFKSMEAQSLTFNGLVSTLKSNIDDLLASFAQPIIDSLKPFLQDGIALTEKLQNAAVTAGTAIARVITFVRNVFTSGNFFNVISSGLKIAGGGLVNTIHKGIIAVTMALYQAFQGLKPIFMSIFSKEMFTYIGTQFDIVAISFTKAILLALKPMAEMLGQEAKFNNQISAINMVEDLMYSRGENAGDILKSKIKEGVEESGRQIVGAFQRIPDNFKRVKGIFDMEGERKEFKKLWDDLSILPESINKPDASKASTKSSTLEEIKEAAEEQVKNAFGAKSPAGINGNKDLPDIARVGGASGITDNIANTLRRNANNLLERQLRILEQIRDARTTEEVNSVAVLA